MKTLALSIVGAAALLATSPSYAEQQDLGDFYSAYTADSELIIQYEFFSNILNQMVYDVGPSDRRVARGRDITTGTRINRQNLSRYRYEGNRVVYHLVNDGHREAITDYRRELEALPAQIDLAELNRNEQLAYWLNLHNAVMLDELAQAYPFRRVNAIRIDGQPLLDAPIVALPDRTLTLNQIRHEIVATNWSDPRVMYGFFTGAVGGPSVQDEAFTGDRVWSQLNAIGFEFVNSLRGVDQLSGSLSVSELYFEYDRLFGGDERLRAHLLRFADGEVRGLVNQANDFVPARFDYSVADLTNGAICGGGIVGQLEVTTAANRSFNGGCEVLPPNTIELVSVIQERRMQMFREGRLGQVTVRDIPTEDTSAEEMGGPNTN